LSNLYYNRALMTAGSASPVLAERVHGPARSGERGDQVP
jgi:hypothetical protein